MNTRPLLLCTDLDRTLIPNGQQPESPQARSLFARLVAQPEVTLAYVSGRHQALVMSAIREYALPVPDFVIGDVGTSVQRCVDGVWERVGDWEIALARDWPGPEALADWLSECAHLRLQEPEQQGPFKLSYYTPADLDVAALRAQITERLARQASRANLIWSVDEAAGVGLLDILPLHGSKRHAIEYVLEYTGHALDTTLFAGDSGNDLEVLVSPIRAILVANAHPEVRAMAVTQSRELDLADRLYCAQGDWRGLNGNYAAGILEGVAHFRPDLL